LRKFLTKAKIKLLFLIFAFMGVIMIAGNISLAVNKDTIDEGVARYFEHNISVGPVYYVFPNRLIFKNITIKKKELSSEHPPLIFPGASVRFFFWDFLFDKGLHLSEVTLFPSNINYYALSQFLEDNYPKILEIIKNSPGNDLKIRIEETLLDFDLKKNPDYIAVELMLDIQGDSIKGAGYFRADQYRSTGQSDGRIQRISKGWPLWHKWQGQLKMDGIVVDHFIIKSDSMYSKLWGSIRSGSMKVNGFLFMDTTIQNSNENQYSLSRYLHDFTTDNDMPNIDIYVLDINGRMDFAFPKIVIDQLNFTLNNIPVTLNGNISLLDPPTLNADISFRHSNFGRGRDIFFEKANVHLTSTWKDKVLTSNGQMDVNFIEHSDLSFSPDNTQISFEGLKFYFDQNRRASVDLDRGDIIYRANANEHRVSIKNFKAVADTRMEGLKIIELNAPFYNGSLTGEVRFDSTQDPTIVTSHIELNGMDTDTLEELLVHFAKFNGLMSSTMDIALLPHLDLRGNITITDGQMTDFNFFNWVSDSFRLPALKAIDFKKASAQFSISKKYIQFRDIRLKNPDVNIEGYFDIDHQNLVSSEITLALSQDLLRKSPKFKPVLKMFSEEDSYLDFDFRLSGSVDAMNFQWVPSVVKKKIQTRIPDFIERKIERNIDLLMEPETGR